jgi:peptidoglycan/xylan/chitin deacetylase (PgdA/CDA1 family)
MSGTTVAFTYDLDAVTLWFDQPNEHSLGVFGADVGAKRILRMHERLDVPATWFIPGHTIESFPDVCASIADAGHDIEHHGWNHTNPAEFESRDAEVRDLERGIEAITDLTGRPPRGYRAPYNDFSEHTLDLLREYEFEWDSSHFGRDFEPYYLPEDWVLDSSSVYDRGTRTDLLEIPVSENRTDWPRLHVGEDIHGSPREQDLYETWRDQFDWMYNNVRDGVYMLTMHPQVTGQAPRIQYLEELARYMQSRPGLTFATMDEIAQRHVD